MEYNSSIEEIFKKNLLKQQPYNIKIKHPFIYIALKNENNQNKTINCNAHYNELSEDFSIEVIKTIKKKKHIYLLKNNKDFLIKRYNDIEIREYKTKNQKDILIYRRKSNGKIKGIYSLTIIEENIKKAKYFSSKGNVLNLKKHPYLFESIQKYIKGINYIEKIEKSIIEVVKSIKIPLDDLKKRLNLCLDNNSKTYQKEYKK